MLHLYLKMLSISFLIRSRRGFVGPLLKPKMMDTVFMADEGGYRDVPQDSNFKMSREC